VLRGGPAYLPIMEAIAIRVLGAGGKVHILTITERERRYRAQELPFEYLGPPPSSIDSALSAVLSGHFLPAAGLDADNGEVLATP
jgi:hypothetical protein